MCQRFTKGAKRYGMCETVDNVLITSPVCGSVFYVTTLTIFILGVCFVTCVICHILYFVVVFYRELYNPNLLLQIMFHCTVL